MLRSCSTRARFGARFGARFVSQTKQSNITALGTTMSKQWLLHVAPFSYQLVGKTRKQWLRESPGYHWLNDDLPRNP